MSLVSPLLALIYRARSRGVHLRVQVNFPNPSLLRTAGVRTFLVSRGLLHRCHLVGRGRIFMGLLPSWTPGRLIRRSRGVTPSSSGGGEGGGWRGGLERRGWLRGEGLR